MERREILKKSVSSQIQVSQNKKKMNVHYARQQVSINGSILWIRRKIRGKWTEAEIGYELTLDTAEKGTWVWGLWLVAEERNRTGKTILRSSRHLDFYIPRSLFTVRAHTQTNFQFVCNNFNCFRKTF